MTPDPASPGVTVSTSSHGIQPIEGAAGLAELIEGSVLRGTRWAVFEPNGEALWARIRTDIEAFLMDLFRNGQLMGRKPQEAYFVRCDRTTTTDVDLRSGRVNIEIGFAPVKPAEFVIVRISQIAAAPQ